MNRECPQHKQALRYSARTYIFHQKKYRIPIKLKAPIQMKIILYRPEIPQNTGNIVRTCAVTGCDLIIVRPMGFSVSDRQLKRAGLDYWEGVNVSFIDNIEEYLRSLTSTFYFFSSKATLKYNEVSYQPDTHLIFGSESSGLPESLFLEWPEAYVKIPMREGQRCLNLATAVGVGIYRAFEDINFF